MSSDPLNARWLERPALGVPPHELLRSLPRRRHQLSRDQVRASQAGRIIGATAEEIAERGYAAATVSAITKRAGVSRKTFYELFHDKEDALLAAYIGVELLIDAIISATADRATAQAATSIDLIAAAARGLLQTLADAPAFTQMFFIEALGAGPRVRQRRDAAIEQLTLAISPLLLAIHATERPGQSPIDHDLVRGLVGAATDAIIRHLVHHEPQTLTRLEPTLTKLTTRLVCSLVDEVHQ